MSDKKTDKMGEKKGREQAGYQPKDETELKPPKGGTGATGSNTSQDK
jgi:hypothetical protein